MSVSICSAATDAHGRELVAHGTAAFPAAFYHDDLDGNPVPWHWHDELEILMVTRGQAVVTAGPESFIVPEGCGAFINAGVLHACRSIGGECLLDSVVFHPRLVGGTVDSVFWQNYLRPVTEDSALHSILLRPTEAWQAQAVQAIAQAFRAGVQEEPGYEFEVRGQLSRLLFLLVSNRPAARRHATGKALRDAERIKVMLQYIQTHYTEELTTEQIARQAAVSVSECLRCFHSTIGSTPIQYLKQYRIQKAVELLNDPSLRISEVGALCGFSEMSYFARTFRQAKGCTPSEYRRAHPADG